VFVDSNAYFADRFKQPQAAVRFSPPPADIRWYYAVDTYFQAIFRITGTVPAAGSLVVEHTYFMEPTKGLLVDALDPPTIAITAPADESAVDQANVTVTGTASDPGGTVASVTVNGTAASLEADGTWSAALTLAQGANAITAVATDLAGNTATATLTITFVGDDPPGPPGPGEICDNCIDDDGNDRVDFEDPSCCTAEAMAVKRLAIIPGKRGTRLALKAGLAQAGLPAGTAWTQDVSLQLRAAGSEVVCARVPATSVVRTKKSARFGDPGHEVASAAGVDKLLLRAKQGGAGTLGASGRPVSLAVPPAGDVQVTLGLRDPGSAEQGNRCAGATVAVKARKKGGVSFP
jgi:hypothetical protein